ncbi:MAG: hypothetical protein MZW92_58485 [Comamonadaceae bacterium]|nr:hypothetical protein [Comamonadaceae bacterium]
MTTHQQKKLDADALLRLPRPLRAAADRRTRSRRCSFLTPGRRQPGDAATCTRAARRWAATCRARSADAPALPAPPLPTLRRASRWQAGGKEMSHDDGLRAHAGAAC